jgi:hypothetical protein
MKTTDRPEAEARKDVLFLAALCSLTVGGLATLAGTLCGVIATGLICGSSGAAMGFGGGVLVDCFMAALSDPDEEGGIE